MSVFLRDIAYSLGESKPIPELAPLFKDKAALSQLLETGLQDFRRSDAPAHVHAEAACRETLEGSPLPRSEIRALVYCSSSFAHPGFTAEIADLCVRLGIPTAMAMGVTLGDCSNLALGMMVSRHLVEPGGMGSVLLVTADCAATEDSRFQESLGTVMSDGAASCIVTGRQLRGAVQLRAVAHSANHPLRKRAEGTALLGVLKTMSTEIAGLRERLLDEARLSLHQIAGVMPNNLSLSTLRLFSTLIGVPAPMYHGNIGRYGHVYAADNLINLKDFLDENPSFAGNLLCFCNATSSWGASVVTVGE